MNNNSLFGPQTYSNSDMRSPILQRKFEGYEKSVGFKFFAFVTRFHRHTMYIMVYVILHTFATIKKLYNLRQNVVS